MKQVKNGSRLFSQKAVTESPTAVRSRCWILPYAIGENNRILADHRKVDEGRLSIKRQKKRDGSRVKPKFLNFYPPRGQLGNHGLAALLGSFQKKSPGNIPGL